MKKRIITVLCILCFIQGGFASEESADYAKKLSLAIDYHVADGGTLIVTLKNSSAEKLELMLNDKEIEGSFTTEGDDKEKFYDKDYLRKLLTSVWFSGVCELERNGEMKWTLKLEELVYSGADDKPVTPQSIAGKSISLSLDRLAVIPTVGKGNIPILIQSNTLKIPKIEQAGTGQPATRPESKSEGGDKPQPEAEGRSR